MIWSDEFRDRSSVELVAGVSRECECEIGVDSPEVEEVEMIMDVAACI